MRNGRGGLSGMPKFNLPWMPEKAKGRELVDLNGEVEPDDEVEPVVPLRRVEKPQDEQSAAVIKMLEQGAAYRRGEVDEKGLVSLGGMNK